MAQTAIFANPTAGVVPQCIFLAKRVYAAENSEGVGSSGKTVPWFDDSWKLPHWRATGFVPLSEMMKAPLSECFSSKELATATSSNPLRIYLYFAASAPSLSHMTSPSAGASAASRKICFSESTLAYLASLVSHPPPPNVLQKILKPEDSLAPLPDLAHSALSELTGVLRPNHRHAPFSTFSPWASMQVFYSVLEIMPAPSQTGSAGTVPVDLPVATSKSSGGFFAARLRRFTSSSHGVQATRAVAATPPVVRPFLEEAALQLEEVFILTIYLMQLLVSNGPLQIIPWELMLHDIVVRSFSLHGLLHSPAMVLHRAAFFP